MVDGAETVTLATAVTGDAVTVIVRFAVNPALVAVITDVPAETPVTSPVEETVATDGVALDQVVGRVTGTPRESMRSVVSWVFVPTGMFDAVALMFRLAVDAGTTWNVMVPVIAPLVAGIVHEP